jgi:multidrug efflux pump subunit AcrA (membrane-fusion protein)
MSIRCAPWPSYALLSDLLSALLIALLIDLTCGLPALAQEAARPDPVLDRCLVSLVEEAKVPAREAGVLMELAVREGDVVRKNDVIAKIDDDQPQMEKRKAQAEYDQALAKAQSDVDVQYSEAAEKVAEAEYKKALESHTKVPGSVTEVERDRLALNEKKSELQIDQARLEQRLAALAAQSKEVEVLAAENSIGRRLIKSPLDGVVVQVFPHQGEWMQPGDPLARVVRVDKLRIEGYVDSSRFGPDKVRDRPVTVEVMLADDRKETFKGRIMVTSPMVESGGDFRVVAEVENRQDPNSQQWLLQPGQTARMTIHSSQRPK